jgi:hypothetical protein
VCNSRYIQEINGIGNYKKNKGHQRWGGLFDIKNYGCVARWRMNNSILTNDKWRSS